MDVAWHRSVSTYDDIPVINTFGIKVKFLVIGDSWAWLDDTNGHFLSTWAQANGHTTEHISRPGSGSVATALDFHNTDPANYDAIFYFPTDLLRVRLHLPNNFSNSPFTYTKQKKFLSRLPELAEKTDSQNMLTPFKNDHPKGIDPNNVQTKTLQLYGIDKAQDIKPVNTETFNNQSIRDFYADIDIKWLKVANYFATQYIFNRAKEYNCPVITINTIFDFDDLYKNNEYYLDFWLLWENALLGFKDNNSVNHIDIRDIPIFLKEFERQTQESESLKNLLYK